MEAEYVQRGGGELFAALKEHLSGRGSARPYAEIAADHEMTEVAARGAAHRMRQRYRQILLSEIAQTVTCQSELDQEIRHLFEVLSQ